MKRLLCAAFVALSVSAGFAQTVDRHTVIDREVDRLGYFTSASVDVPADANGFITVVTTMALTDRKNPNKSIKFGLEVFDTQAGIWKLVASTEYIGGDYIDRDGTPNPLPRMSVSIESFRGRQIRCYIDVPSKQDVGARIDFSTP